MMDKNYILNRVIDYLTNINMSKEDIYVLLNEESLISIYINSLNTNKLTRRKK